MKEIIKLVGAVFFTLTVLFIINMAVVSLFIKMPGGTDDQCKDICESNELSFNKTIAGGYRNPVCYCRTQEGATRTFVL
jgi:hypothetical protein